MSSIYIIPFKQTQIVPLTSLINFSTTLLLCRLLLYILKTGQSQGCAPSTEAVLRLKEKQVQECLDVRRRHDHEVAWRMIYACLWKFRSLPLIHDVESWFTAPSIDMTNGCNKLRTIIFKV